MTVHTELGDIIAEPSPDMCYPGMYLSLRRGDQTYPICLLEVDQVNLADKTLNAHVWDPQDLWGDPVFTLKTPEDTVLKVLEEEFLVVVILLVLMEV